MVDNTESKAPPPAQVWPTLRAHDALGLIRFLVDVVGFDETAVFADGDLVMHCQLSWPLGGGVMLGSARGGPDDAWGLEPGTFGAYVVADDIAALHARIEASGAATELSEVTTTDYDSSSEFRMRDPEGNLWSFGTYRGEPRRPATEPAAG